MHINIFARDKQDFTVFKITLIFFLVLNITHLILFYFLNSGLGEKVIERKRNIKVMKSNVKFFLTVKKCFLANETFFGFF